MSSLTLKIQVIQEAFKQGDFKEFERHSRLGMVDEEGFHKEVERLRRIGAKHVSLKTGAYRPVDLARAVKYASDAEIDLLTVDGAGGGTGMSPWRMMNEWGIPTVYLESLLHQFLRQLDRKGAFVPSCAMAGGLALGRPYLQSGCISCALYQGDMPREGIHDGSDGGKHHRRDDQEGESASGHCQIRNNH